MGDMEQQSEQSMDQSPSPTYVENRSSAEKIPDSVRPVIDQSKQLYHEVFGDHLVSLYLEGSAGRGDYVPGLSDVDLVGIVDRLRTEADLEALSQGRQQIIDATDLHKLDLGTSELSLLEQKPRAQFILAVDGVLLDGQRYHPTAQFPPIGPELARFLDAPIPKRIKAAHERLAKVQAGEKLDLAFWSRWIAKQTMRLGLGVAMTRRAVYTANMAEMPNVVKEVVPEISDDIDRLNRAYLEPTGSVTDYEELLSVIDRIESMAEAAGVIEPEPEHA